MTTNIMNENCEKTTKITKTVTIYNRDSVLDS